MVDCGAADEPVGDEPTSACARPGPLGNADVVIRHVGRRSSGRTYETPVDIIATDDGLLIALPYGTQADWLRNVLAAGSRDDRQQGESFDVDRPIIAATADVAGPDPAHGRCERCGSSASPNVCICERSADGSG